MLLTLLQFDPAKWFGTQPLERFPAGLSLLYLGGAAFIVLLLLLMTVMTRRARSPFAAENEADLPDEVRRRVGSASANRALWLFRIVFTLLAFGVFGFHIYWTVYARSDKDKEFAKLEQRDIRFKRAAKADISGWILDRSGTLDKSFAYWKIEKKTDEKTGKADEDLVREHPLDKEMAHLLGNELTSPGLERSLFKKAKKATPEALEVLTSKYIPKDDRDVRLTIDREYQKFAFEQLNGKKGAIVVLNPQTGDVLAVASNPTFALKDAQTRDDYRKLESDIENNPLISRAMRDYYVPGSTFKAFTMIGAFRNKMQNAVYTTTPGGFAPFKGSRTVTDDNRSCEYCGPTGIADAFEFSSNQYFSWMAVELGSDKMRDTASVLGIEAVSDRNDALNRPFQTDIWNASNEEIKGALALRQSTIVTGKTGDSFSLYDLAIQGMGQGLAGQQTPFQMALVTAAAANMNGDLMKPKIEMDIAPEVFANVLTPQQAAEVRSIMLAVTRGGKGTAKNVAAIVGDDILVAGKTGTAQKEVIVFKNGKPVTYTIKRRNRKTGVVTEVTRTRKRKRIDGWFIAIAPVNSATAPQLAIAVVIEDIGSRYGGGTAGPVAANMINKARQLGLMGDALKPKSAPQTNSGNNRPPRRR